MDLKLFYIILGPTHYLLHFLLNLVGPDNSLGNGYVLIHTFANAYLEWAQQHGQPTNRELTHVISKPNRTRKDCHKPPDARASDDVEDIAWAKMSRCWLISALEFGNGLHKFTQYKQTGLSLKINPVCSKVRGFVKLCNATLIKQSPRVKMLSGLSSSDMMTLPSGQQCIEKRLAAT